MNHEVMIDGEVYVKKLNEKVDEHTQNTWDHMLRFDPALVGVPRKDWD